MSELLDPEREVIAGRCVTTGLSLLSLAETSTEDSLVVTVHQSSQPCAEEFLIEISLQVSLCMF
jgi:hypothetical protein